jgi:hypothetical protein
VAFPLILAVPIRPLGAEYGKTRNLQICVNGKEGAIPGRTDLLWERFQMRWRPKLGHILWVLILVFIGIGWSMKGTTDPDEWMSLYSTMVFGNMFFAFLWIIERDKRIHVTRLVDPEIRRHL